MFGQEFRGLTGMAIQPSRDLQLYNVPLVHNCCDTKSTTQAKLTGTYISENDKFKEF